LKHVEFIARVRDLAEVQTNEEAERARKWAESHTGHPRLYTGADGKPKIPPWPWE